jgi:hypothetical protein
MEVRPEIVAAVERVFPAVEGLAGGRFPGWRPSPEMEARGLLYLDGPHPILSEAQCAAIAMAASQLGEKGCYLSYVERIVGPVAIQDFELDALSFDRYRELQPAAALDHVVVSQSGEWGVFVDEEGVAVVAGPTSFIASLYRTLPPTKEQATRYASDILSTQHPGLIAWLTELLTEILGPEEAAAVFSSAESS